MEFIELEELVDMETEKSAFPAIRGENGLPEGWEIKKLGEVCKLKNGFAFKSTEYKNEGIPVIRISDINEGIVTTGKAVRVSPNEEYDNYLVEDNDILVAMSGATTGKFGIFKSEEKAYQNQRVGKFKILNEKKLNNQFLYYQLHALKRQIEKDAYGGAQPNISSTKIEQMEIVVPHISEQQKIVSKIEELFSELDKGKQQLETAREQLKIYRQSVLKWAFEGKFTNSSTSARIELTSNNLPGVGVEPNLPDGWSIESLGNYIDKIEAGKSFKCDERPPRENEVGIVKVSAVTWGEFNEDESKTIYSLDQFNPKYLIEKGDFLFSRANTIDLVGSCVIVKQNSKQLMLSDKILRFDFNENILKEYVLYFLRSQAGRREIESNSTGNQDSMRNIGQQRIKQIQIPVPHISEQQKIVEEIESRLSVADKVEETISQSLQQAETLRQSILKQAFEGRLI